ncbi:hypothetical protein WJX72_001848 [[Myrmecia] bisecta]|uniref:ribonuclease Z n=1 Tax=[Myrmecia] bisecta TaxID=41462 RepID=A0AAW1PT59_9CHLO
MGKKPDSRSPSISSHNSCSYVQVLGPGTDTGDTTPSVLLFFDRQRYLFNVGEGFQRFCVEHKIKLAKASAILMTRVSTEAAGGLPGMLLTMADSTAGGLLAGRPLISLHGPQGMNTMLPAIAGKFRPQKAAALGVPRGPLFGKLVKGETVKAANGKDVKPSDVMEDPVPGPVAIITDCPDSTYLPALLQSEELQKWASGQAGGGGDGTPPQPVACVVHLAPAKVVHLPEYQQWMATFGSSTRHILVHPEAIPPATVMRGSATVAAKCNFVAPGIFPLHQGWQHAAPSGPAALPPSAVAGQNMLKFHLRPAARAGLDAGEVPAPLDVAAIHEEIRTSKPEVVAAARKALTEGTQPDAAAPAVIAQAGRRSLEIVFLGTGAAIPSKYRNVTSIYLDLFDKGGMLLDCGEGSYGQLARRYGAEGAKAVVAGLKLVWISHIHADHHAGLTRVLSVRRQLLGPDAPPLLVLGPRPLRRTLAAFSRLEAMSFRYIDCLNTLPGAQVDASLTSALADVTTALGLTKLESVSVQHCAHSFGLILESHAGWKLAFSGDTRPCKQLVEAARDATVLIHEATFEDALEEEALAKNHSLTHEAIDIGNQARAYRTILTHFSQRYPKMPVIDKSFNSTTAIAFDLMTVNLADLPLLPHLVAPLALLFKEEMEEEGAPAEGDAGKAGAV